MRSETSVFDGAPIVRFPVVAGSVCAAPEVIEKFTKYVEMIAPVFGLTADRAQHGHKRFHQWSPKSSLKRASSRTKSSKRRLAAVSSRSANQASALADIAHNKRAKCARSPRSVKMRIRSVIIFAVEAAIAGHRSAVITNARIRPSTAPFPNLRAKASVAFAKATSIREAPRASISFFNGVP